MISKNENAGELGKMILNKEIIEKALLDGVESLAEDPAAMLMLPENEQTTARLIRLAEQVNSTGSRLCSYVFITGITLGQKMLLKEMENRTLEEMMVDKEV